MTKIGLIQFLLLFVISAAWGQKVKYKDIYALLGTGQYEQAEPFLKHYLRQNPDTPSGWLFMGNIFREKAAKNDVLKQTGVAVANMDSAIAFYARATQLIDERELRRNKDYYDSYNRRDLRTGAFGVKLSDIQFDISKKVEALKERIAAVKMTKHYFALADTTYKRANAIYRSLQEKYPTQRQLYLRADAQTIADLTTLRLQFDSCMKAFGAYKTAASLLGKMGYQQQATLVAIEDFRKDGATPADFYRDEVPLWDYKEFSGEVVAVIQKEIMPLREHLIDYDRRINTLREKLDADSVSVSNDLTQLIDKLLYDQLKKYDAEPLPMLVFAMKTTDLSYRSMLLEHKPLRDSANLHLQIRMLRDEIALLHKVDSTGALISDALLAAKAPDYTAFITGTYGDLPALKAYVRSLQHYSAQQQQLKQVVLDGYLSALNYIVDGADSIPLRADSLGAWKPVLTVPEKFTIGVNTADTAKLQGYFYTITPSRTVDVKALFPLDPGFHLSDVSSANAIARSDGGDQLYYVLLYSARAVKEKFPATLAKVYRSDGLAWKKDVALSFTPAEMLLNPATGELVILNEGRELVVDKNGKVVE